jgi:hypothetical protein
MDNLYLFHNNMHNLNRERKKVSIGRKKENLGLDLRQAQKCGRVKLVNGILTIPLLIIGSPKEIQICFHWHFLQNILHNIFRICLNIGGIVVVIVW